MKLGLLVATDRNLKHLRGIVLSALARGHEVEVFVMAEGVRLLCDEGFREIIARPGLTASYCSFNAMMHGIDEGCIPAEAEPASQINNLMMARSSDRVITL